MAIERTMVSSKLDDENLEFLEQWEKQQKPYSISQSSLVNLCVRIVRKLHRRGQLSLKPEDLQVLLSTEGTESTAGKRK